jgi:hypothetical protein
MSKTTIKTSGSSTAAATKPARRLRRMAREPKATGVADAGGLEGSAAAAPQSDPADQLLAPSDATSQGKPGAAARTNVTPPRPTKSRQVLALLQRPEGATLAELIEATGWQQHTVRAALTGLRKRGHEVVRSKRGETTCYVVTAVVAASVTTCTTEAEA